MQPLPPSPVRPAYIRASSSDYFGLPYLRPESPGLGPQLTPGVSNRSASTTPTLYAHTRDSLVPFDIQRRAAARPVPNLYINDLAYIPPPEAFESLEVVEPERAGSSSRLSSLCLRLTAALMVAVIPGILIYGAYKVVKNKL